jgi:hypothetical protein
MNFVNFKIINFHIFFVSVKFNFYYFSSFRSIFLKNIEYLKVLRISVPFGLEPFGTEPNQFLRFGSSCWNRHAEVLKSISFSCWSRLIWTKLYENGFITYLASSSDVNVSKLNFSSKEWAVIFPYVQWIFLDVIAFLYFFNHTSCQTQFKSGFFTINYYIIFWKVLIPQHFSMNYWKNFGNIFR